MCGIAGRLHHDPGRAVDPGVLRRMCGALGHRGPDDQGVVVRGAVGLGHRRLSVTDLSTAAHQPMSNADGSMWIVFSGEIYNFLELRAMLEHQGHAFHSRSDTEVVLRLYATRGVDCLHALRGTFAFAIWDERHRTLLLARDRLGLKPLFYRAAAGSLSFASELKALLRDPDIAREVDPAAIHHYLTYRYVPAPHTIWKGVAKLPPAHYLLCRDGTIALERYWKLSYLPKHAARTPAQIEWLEQELRARVEESVRYRLMGDVPLGAFLSGGIGSSAVVAYMSRLTERPVRTFSIGFDSNSFDELPAAGIVARYFRTGHTVFLVRQQVAELLPALARSFDEPFADPSAIPTFILARLARRQVKVVLTGVGGDENFAGYERYAANRLAMRMGVVANLLGSRAARAMLDAVAGGGDDYRSRFKRFADQLGQSPGARNAGWLTQLGAPEKARLYDSDFAQEMRALDSRELLFERYREAGTEDFMDEVLYADMTGFLPDCLLVRNDTATMAHGLESRAPLLDHRLVEFAARIPFELKLHRGRTQWILRRALRGVLPASILHRPKRAFRLPLDSWLRGALRETARELLLGARARHRGYFRPDAVTRLVEEHESGRRSHPHEIWTLMMLELWHREYVDAAVTEAAVA